MGSIRINGIVLVLILFIMLSLPNANAAPTSPFQVSSGGLQIEYTKYDVIQLNTDHRFHVHVINDTAQKTNLTTNCLLHVYNQTGWDMDIGSQWMEFELYNGIDFAKTVAGGNFSTVGEYAYVIQCNSTSQVGFISVPITVTPTGEIIDTPHSIFYVSMLVFAISLFVLALFGAFMIPYDNNRNMAGYVIEISNRKYLKVGCGFAAYLIFMIVLYFSWMISYAFMSFEFVSNLLRFTFFASVYILLPVFILTLYFLITAAIRDSKIAEALSGGLGYRDG